MGDLNISAKAAAHATRGSAPLMERFVRAFQDQGGDVGNWYTIGARHVQHATAARGRSPTSSNNPNSPKAVAFRNLRAGDDAEPPPPPPPTQDIVVSAPERDGARGQQRVVHREARGRSRPRTSRQPRQGHRRRRRPVDDDDLADVHAGQLERRADRDSSPPPRTPTLPSGTATFTLSAGD